MFVAIAYWTGECGVEVNVLGTDTSKSKLTKRVEAHIKKEYSAETTVTRETPTEWEISDPDMEFEEYIKIQEVQEKI